MFEVIIIGGGLSGLTAAYELKKSGISCLVLEAQEKLGGRMETIQGALGTPLEMGAAWYSEIHVSLISLLSELYVKTFRQFSEGITLFQTKSFEPPQKFYVPAAETPSYRIQGGSAVLINTLETAIGTDSVRVNMGIRSIREEGDTLVLTSKTGEEFSTRMVISAMPPQVFLSSIQITPALPAALQSVMAGAQTWMEGSTKFAVEYKQPFWRDKGYSGMVFSQAGIIVEIYDHSNVEETRFALKGFLSGSSVNYPPEERQILVMGQLEDLFGPEAAASSGYYEKNWSDQYISAGNADFMAPHANNGHPVLQESYLGGKLRFTGSETATVHPGYMDGAVFAGREVARVITAGRLV